MPTFTADSHFDDRTMLKEDGGEEPQKRPLLDSVRSEWALDPVYLGVPGRNIVPLGRVY